MSAQSYWGQGPTYGAIHKQDFTADGTGSQVINLNYDINWLKILNRYLIWVVYKRFLVKFIKTKNFTP